MKMIKVITKAEEPTLRLRTVCLLLCVLLTGLFPAMAHAEGTSREYSVKAAFVYNFAQFVEWPATAFESPQSPIVIGVVGEDPFGGALEQVVAGKTAAGGRPFSVKHLTADDDLKACQILFISTTDGDSIASILKKVAGLSVLTIGESERFPWSGGVIRFFLEDNKVRFEINQQAADTAKLKISSKLMKLARMFNK